MPAFPARLNSHIQAFRTCWGHPQGKGCTCQGAAILADEMMVHCKYLEPAGTETVKQTYEDLENPSEEQEEYLENQFQGNP